VESDIRTTCARPLQLTGGSRERATAHSTTAIQRKLEVKGHYGAIGRIVRCRYGRVGTAIGGTARWRSHRDLSQPAFSTQNPISSRPSHLDLHPQNSKIAYPKDV